MMDNKKMFWFHKGEQVEFTDDVAGCCDRYERFLRGTYKIG